ncbi:MAG: ATP-binding cassette domain-containing protein [Ignavibacteriales bacterium]|nr:ATP-binding cassette domain-containing protein [Ignavibacteriales bacterium]MCB9260213.1 ATP-binding cassette domain-containing protein [Ignavibacteriales bacterium]
MLEIRNISKYFNANLVLDDISFTINKGRIFGIIGPNGAGKTTTLRILLKILTQSSGEILFNNSTLDQQFFNITGYLPEERGLYPKSSVTNILIYLAQLKGMKYSEASKKTKYWLNKLNLEEYAKYNIEELSKGNQQKVQFISAILHEPQILILDEPFSGFDPVNQSIFREIIEELKNDRYIILSTHLMDLAESLCDDIFLINNGKKIISGELKSILQAENRNIYKISFQKNVDEIDLTVLNQSNILEKNSNSIQIDISDINISGFLDKYSEKLKITEFKKVSPSLHQLFISLVEKKD